MLHQVKSLVSNSPSAVPPPLYFARHFFERFAQPLFVCQTDWTVTYANPAAETLLGIRSSHAARQPLWALWPESARRQTEKEHQGSLAEGKEVELTTHPLEAPDLWLGVSVVDCEFGLVVNYRNILEKRKLSELENRLIAIVESADDAIISKTLDGTILSWNRGAERIFGYRSDEIVGRHVAVLAAPGYVDEIPRILARVASGERVEHYETKRKTKDGRILTVSLTVSPIRDASGAIIGASKVARDITDVKKLTELQERLASIVESSDDAIISKDLTGVITSWNMGAQKLFGYRADEVVGQHISMLAPDDVVDEIPAILARLARGEVIDHYQTKRRTKDGRILIVSLTVSPIRDASGKVIGASKVGRDITDRERYERELKEANAELLRSNADLQQFAYSASHDLQEPLRMVSTYGELLQKRFGEKLGAAGREYLGFAIEGATRMEQLLKDLRAYTKASTLDQEPHQSIDAGTALEKALANLEALIQENGARVTRTALPAVRAHEFQLEQLFQNLIGNAIRYRSDAAPVIHVGAELHEREWVFSVRDNGIGIDPQYQEQIFGIFKRLHAGSDYAGTGMGLAICERIAQRLGGRIWVESQPGKGSTFLFAIPEIPGG
jgi:PAS domain S-box-containing protein